MPWRIVASNEHGSCVVQDGYSTFRKADEDRVSRFNDFATVEELQKSHLRDFLYDIEHYRVPPPNRTLTERLLDWLTGRAQ